MDGHQLFVFFSGTKPNCLTEMNLKETSKWQIEKILKTAFIQDGESSQTALCKDSCLFLGVTESSKWIYDSINCWRQGEYFWEVLVFAA